MYRVVASDIVQVAIDGPLRDTFLREELAIPVAAGGALSLVRLRSRRHASTRGAIVLLHGYGMNRHTWHLSRRSFSAYLAHLGYDVFVLELRGVGQSHALGSRMATHLDQNILEDIPLAVSSAVARSGHSKVVLVGHSMGGLIAYCVMPDLAARLAAVVTISGVYSFESGSRLLRLVFAAGGRVKLPRVLRRVPIGVRRIAQVLEEAIHVVDSRVALLLMPAQAWYPRGMERELLLEQLEKGWDRGSLGVMQALLRVGREGGVLSQTGRRYLDEMRGVDLPLLVVSAQGDTLLPPRDTRGAYLHSESSDKTYVLFGPQEGHAPYGHLDVILGRTAPREVWPKIADWLLERVSAPQA